MDRDTPKPRFRNPIVAALETSAAIRLDGDPRSETSANGGASELNTIDRTAAIVDAASARIKANDFSGVEALFAGQGFALDAMFDTHARSSTVDDIRFALRAQAQCRATFRTLMQMKNPQVEKFLHKRNGEPAKSSG